MWKELLLLMYTARLVGQPNHGRRLLQPEQTTIRKELLGYHNEKNINNPEDDNNE